MGGPLQIALYHGFELTGSGSNEYTRYLARTLAQLGHTVEVICGEPEPAALDFVSRAVAYDADGCPTELFRRPVELPGRVTLHRLPRTSVQPVYVTDKQREGRVAPFADLSADELAEYHRAMLATVGRVLRDERVDVLHANHLVYQPVVAAEACAAEGVPFYIVPHGSSIEYTLNEDPRYLELARPALEACCAIAWISREVRERVLALYPDLAPALRARSVDVGVGTDTSLFTPLPPEERPAALARLRALCGPGGKTAAQRDELRRALDAGDLGATQRYWDAYDHKRPDADLAARLEQIPLDRDWLLFVGSMTYGKGIQTLLAALPGILARRPGTQLLLVGSGTFREVLEGLVHALASGNEPLFDALVSRGCDLDRTPGQGPLEDLRDYAADPEQRRVLFAQGPSLADHVHWLGRLDHERLRFLFPCCRIGVFPSVIKEASPLVFAEALANGVLPMGAYHSGLRDGLDSLRPDLPAEIWRRMRIEVEPARRVPSLVENVSELLGMLETRDLSGDLRRLAEQRYDWRSVAASLVEAVAARLPEAGSGRARSTSRV